MRISWNVAFFSLLFILYVTNTQRLYHYNRTTNSRDKSKYFRCRENSIIFIALCLNYWHHHFIYKNQVGKDFQFYLFFLGNAKCRHE